MLSEPTLPVPGQTVLTSSFSLTRATQVINVCSDQRLLDSLRDCNKLLDMVQKSLSEYLETKRSAFPRWAPQGPCPLCWRLPTRLGCRDVRGPRMAGT